MAGPLGVPPVGGVSVGGVSVGPLTWRTVPGRRASGGATLAR
jgi:hypothetical protein